MDKYIIFLPDEILKFKKCFFYFSKYKKFVNKLNKYGITVIYKKDIDNFLSVNKFSNLELTFDYEKKPDLNKLYIYLSGSLYFSDENYSRYRMNLEKELLLLLCGYLGAKQIKIIDNNTENNTQILSSEIDIQNCSENIKFETKKNKDYKNTIKETYSLENKNLLFEKSKEDFENQFYNEINKIDPNLIFYYKICPKLILFVSKRFNLRMLNYSYQLEQEFKNEKIIQVKILLFNYGIGLEYKNHLETNTKYLYDVIFYENNELFFYNKKNEKIEKDIFCKLRNEYDIDKKIMTRDVYKDWGGYPNDIFNEVCNYAIKLGISDKLTKWFESDNNNKNKLMGDCHCFKDETDVKNWFTLHIINF